MAASVPAGLQWSTLEQRKHNGTNLYYQIYLWKVQQLPPDVHRFCDPQLPAHRRKELLNLLRSLEDESSCQRLQILFSFSVPSPQVLDLLCAQHLPLVSAGAGTGYWEFLLQCCGLDVVAFDQNSIFPPEMRYTEVMTGGPELLENYPDRALFLAWPDADDVKKQTVVFLEYQSLLNNNFVWELQRNSRRDWNMTSPTGAKVGSAQERGKVSPAEESSHFSLDCLIFFRGQTLFHIGELLGETLSSNPWGQSTSRDFQLALAEDFCCVKRIRLPRWPGHVDSFSVWKRKNPQFVLCDGAHFQYVETQLEEDE